MPLVRVVKGGIRIPPVYPVAPPPPPHPKVELVREDGRSLALPFAPRIVHDGFAPTYDQLTRSALAPLLMRQAPQLRTMACAVTLGHPDHQQSVEGLIAVLREFAASGQRLRWRNFGPMEVGWWRMTAMGLSDEVRQHGTNAITRATVDLTFTEASDVAIGVGPVSGGAVTPPAPPAPGPAAPSGGKTYTVKKGDTLSGISQKFYGTASKWKQIADANGVKDPKKLKVGQVLKIP